MRPLTKIKMLFEHFTPSFKGILGLFFSNPVFCIRLVILRFFYFLTNSVAFKLTTPDNYTISRNNELIWYWSIFIEKELWHPSWIDAIKTIDKPIVLDVGANAGLFSHLIYHLNKSASIIAFEPLPAMAKCIAQLKEQLDADITIINKAVSDKAGEATLYASSDNDVCASLIRRENAYKSIRVGVTTLDSELSFDKIFLAKIDVEGLECSVIEGAQETIARTRFLILEALSSHALQNIKAMLGDAWICHKVGVTDYFFERQTGDHVL